MSVRSTIWLAALGGRWETGWHVYRDVTDQRVYVDLFIAGRDVLARVPVGQFRETA